MGCESSAPLEPTPAPLTPPKTKEDSPTAGNTLKNSAFVFIKPHANTSDTRLLVQTSLLSKSFKILLEGELNGKQIDEGMLIDQHYYAIASKATLLKPSDMPVPVDKFEEFFGVSWKKCLDDGVVFNAADACKYLGVDSNGLFEVWSPCKKVKFGGGFYCGEISVPDKPTIYIFNGFFMSLRSKFVDPKASIHYYVIEFSPNDMSWSDFRGKFLGPTDPANAPPESLRGKIFADWEALGLKEQPNVSDNGVHASASPFEGLVEKMNWLKVYPPDDPFGKHIVASGISLDVIKEWSVDPQVKGRSLFDQLEDTNSDECLTILKDLSK